MENDAERLLIPLHLEKAREGNSESARVLMLLLVEDLRRLAPNKVAIQKFCQSLQRIFNETEPAKVAASALGLARKIGRTTKKGGHFHVAIGRMKKVRQFLGRAYIDGELEVYFFEVLGRIVEAQNPGSVAAKEFGLTRSRGAPKRFEQRDFEIATEVARFTRKKKKKRFRAEIDVARKPKVSRSQSQVSSIYQANKKEARAQIAIEEIEKIWRGK